MYKWWPFQDFFCCDIGQGEDMIYVSRLNIDIFSLYTREWNIGLKKFQRMCVSLSFFLVSGKMRFGCHTNKREEIPVHNRVTKYNKHTNGSKWTHCLKLYTRDGIFGHIKPEINGYEMTNFLGTVSRDFWFGWQTKIKNRVRLPLLFWLWHHHCHLLSRQGFFGQRWPFLSGLWNIAITLAKYLPFSFWMFYVNAGANRKENSYLFSRKFGQ